MYLLGAYLSMRGDVFAGCLSSVNVCLSCVSLLCVFVCVCARAHEQLHEGEDDSVICRSCSTWSNYKHHLPVKG